MSRCDEYWMKLAAEQAEKGIGFVEPNPPVGCLIVNESGELARGFHRRFGGPHAEIEALRQLDQSLHDATIYITLEPCTHQGKTPPCVDELLRRKPRRVVVAVRDPNPQVNGRGIEVLRQAGIEVDESIGVQFALKTLRPYLKRCLRKMPWVIAKWAMSLDGKIATRSGDSRWLSSQDSRRTVHQLRGRVDAIMTGIGTAIADDPLLTARPAGPRTAVRIVLDSQARLPVNSQLVQTARNVPLIVAVALSAAADRIDQLRSHGCEVWIGSNEAADLRLQELLGELANRGMTNVLVEGGSRLMGTLNELDTIDELRLYLTPHVLGGAAALSPVGGSGVERLIDARQFQIESVHMRDSDVEIVAVKTNGRR